MIKLENITKIFSTDDMDTYALNDVGFQVNRGDFVSICGPSGGGKSTLLSILATHDFATSGNYFFDGVNVSQMNSSQILNFRRKKIGFIFQEFNLIDDLNVEENISIHLKGQQRSKSEINETVSMLIHQFGLQNRNKHYPSQLSGGQQQRVAIARALANSPEIIFADEPTGNLDSKNAAIVLEFLKAANKNKTTVCMVTHDNEIAKKADRVIFIKDGKVEGC